MAGVKITSMSFTTMSGILHQHQSAHVVSYVFETMDFMGFQHTSPPIASAGTRTINCPLSMTIQMSKFMIFSPEKGKLKPLSIQDLAHVINLFQPSFSVTRNRDHIVIPFFCKTLVKT